MSEPTLSQSLSAIANIHLHLCFLEQEYKNLSIKKSPIEIMIDETTGFQAENNKSSIKSIVYCLKQIIKSKKLIGSDYSSQAKFLTKVRGLNKIKSTKLKTQ